MSFSSSEINVMLKSDELDLFIEKKCLKNQIWICIAKVLKNTRREHEKEKQLLGASSAAAG